MFVVVGGVLVDDEAKVAFSGDQEAVGGLASAGSDPALGDRVHPGHAGKDRHHAGAESGEDRIEGLSEVAGVVADQVPDTGSAHVVQVHQQVTRLLGCPLRGDVAGDAGDVHAPGAVLDEEQDEQAPEKHGVHVEDVDGEDPLRLSGEEP